MESRLTQKLEDLSICIQVLALANSVITTISGVRRRCALPEESIPVSFRIVADYTPHLTPNTEIIK